MKLLLQKLRWVDYMNIDIDFVIKLRFLLETNLIDYTRYYPWCDDIILSYEEPPIWILDLAVEKLQENAIVIINKMIYYENLNCFAINYDFYVGGLFVKYILKLISWKTFLLEAGYYTDGNGIKEECEYFYRMCTGYEDKLFDKQFESTQKQIIEKRFSFEINEMHKIYNYFLKYNLNNVT